MVVLWDYLKTEQTNRSRIVRKTFAGVPPD
jgi:hypothetical protein